jgi:hypothetical protein
VGRTTPTWEVDSVEASCSGWWSRGPCLRLRSNRVRDGRADDDGAVAPDQSARFLGYYDGHKDTYLSTDISNKAEAKMMHITYSASIGKLEGLPEIYLVEGRAAPGQLAVFGSEPGETDYSPLWTVTILTCQVNKLEKTSSLTERPGNVVLNCPDHQGQQMLTPSSPRRSLPRPPRRGRPRSVSIDRDSTKG